MTPLRSPDLLLYQIYSCPLTLASRVQLIASALILGVRVLSDLINDGLTSNH